MQAEPALPVPAATQINRVLNWLAVLKAKGPLK